MELQRSPKTTKTQGSINHPERCRSIVEALAARIDILPRQTPVEYPGSIHELGPLFGMLGIAVDFLACFLTPNNIFSKCAVSLRSMFFSDLSRHPGSSSTKITGIKPRIWKDHHSERIQRKLRLKLQVWDSQQMTDIQN